MKSLFFLIFLATSVPASLWQRHIVSGKSESFDTSQPHPLAYFIEDPFLRDDGDQFCTDCTPSGKSAVHLQHRFATELKQVGSLHGLAIYDLFYRFEDHVDTGEIDWKSILVEVAPGQFREIYHLQPTAAKIEAAFLLKAGDEEILGTRDAIPGTGAFYYEDYFWFSPSGPVRIDIEAIAAATKSVPERSGCVEGLRFGHGRVALSHAGVERWRRKLLPDGRHSGHKIPTRSWSDYCD